MKFSSNKLTILINLSKLVTLNCLWAFKTGAPKLLGRYINHKSSVISYLIVYFIKSFRKWIWSFTQSIYQMKIAIYTTSVLFLFFDAFETAGDVWIFSIRVRRAERAHENWKNPRVPGSFKQIKNSKKYTSGVHRFIPRGTISTL